MGDYDENGVWNKHLDSFEPLPTVDEIEEDDYCTAQVRDMYERIQDQKAVIDALKKYFNPMYLEALIALTLREDIQ